MQQAYDAVVIGAGLGGLAAAALLARAGRKVLVIERSASAGGAATTYKIGDLVVEAALHATTDPHNPRDPKHDVLARLDLLDAVEWVPTGPFYEVRGGPVGAPFVLPDGFAAARTALSERFPARREAIARLLGEMEGLVEGLGVLQQGRAAFHHPQTAVSALLKLRPLVAGWRRSLADAFDHAFGDDEGVKCALAANLAYYHDDPATLWWIFFAVAQGSFLGNGGRFIRGGSQRLSNALRRAVLAAGGEIVLRRTVNAIHLDRAGRPAAVVHVDRDGADPVEVPARNVIANAAPAIIGSMLPEPASAAWGAAYAGRPLSISLFAATLGLDRPPAQFGVRSYSTFLLPDWMRRLSDYADAAACATTPEVRMPPLAVVDYSCIDSQLGGPPFPMSVVGIDRTANWAGLDRQAYAAQRERLLAAIVAALETEFPGIGGAIVAKTLNTARAIQDYLNAPEGAIYGFAPRPPEGPIFKGIGRSPATPVPGLYLAGSYGGMGGFTGAIRGGGAAADCVLRQSGA